jgi:hypothetical protein
MQENFIADRSDLTRREEARKRHRAGRWLLALLLKP